MMLTFDVSVALTLPGTTYPIIGESERRQGQSPVYRPTRP